MIVDILRNDICPLHIEDEGINTLSIMDDYKMPQLPVVNENNALLGLIEEDAIVNMKDLNKSLEFIQHKINKVFVLFDAHIFEAMKIITEHQLSLLPVVNQDHNYIGYLEAIDIISKLGAMCTHYSNTCIIVIATKPKNYMLSEISRLIEENTGTILTLWHELKEEKTNIHILIRCTNSERIIKGLERYDYDVSNTFINKSNKNNLDDRFESFIKYLNP